MKRLMGPQKFQEHGQEFLSLTGTPRGAHSVYLQHIFLTHTVFIKGPFSTWLSFSYWAHMQYMDLCVYVTVSSQEHLAWGSIFFSEALCMTLPCFYNSVFKTQAIDPNGAAMFSASPPAGGPLPLLLTMSPHSA